MVNPLYRGLVLIVVTGLLGACSLFPSKYDDNQRLMDARQTYRARMAKEVEVMVAQPGVTICRQFTAGIGNREWVRGTVVEAESAKIKVRIDDPGQFSYNVDGVEIQRGVMIVDATDSWIPCQ